MLKNLFTIAIRNILKDKTYSAINVLGLTIGITCSLFLLLYILDELSYDRYHKNADNIYRIVLTLRNLTMPSPGLWHRFPWVRSCAIIIPKWRTWCGFLTCPVICIRMESFSFMKKNFIWQTLRSLICSPMSL